jgi:hypothetical protein
MMVKTMELKGKFAVVTGSISPDGQTLAVVERLTNNIDTFHINANGTLGPLVVNPSAGVGAFSGRFAPDGKLIVSETNALSATSCSVYPASSAFVRSTLMCSFAIACDATSCPSAT